jgi:hypothetical protein
MIKDSNDVNRASLDLANKVRNKRTDSVCVYVCANVNVYVNVCV